MKTAGLRREMYWFACADDPAASLMRRAAREGGIDSVPCWAHMVERALFYVLKCESVVSIESIAWRCQELHDNTAGPSCALPCWGLGLGLCPSQIYADHCRVTHRTVSPGLGEEDNHWCVPEGKEPPSKTVQALTLLVTCRD
jgi:hypothetical protein